jgi:3-oxoacyl-ACP reductase-like protein
MSTGALLAARRFKNFVNGISGLRRKILDRTTCHEPLHAAESYWEGRGPTGNSFEAESTSGFGEKENEMGMVDGKVAIVTGATSGIGTRTVEALIEEGARVVFTGPSGGGRPGDC